MGPTRSKKRRAGGRGECSYCHKHHKGGPSGDSCGGRNVKAMVIVVKKPEEQAKIIQGIGFRIAHHERRVARIERAHRREEARAKRTPGEQLKILEKRGFTQGREVTRLKALISSDNYAESAA